MLTQLPNVKDQPKMLTIKIYKYKYSYFVYLDKYPFKNFIILLSSLFSNYLAVTRVQGKEDRPTPV